MGGEVPVVLGKRGGSLAQLFASSSYKQFSGALEKQGDLICVNIYKICAIRIYAFLDNMHEKLKSNARAKIHMQSTADLLSDHKSIGASLQPKNGMFFNGGK